MTILLEYPIWWSKLIKFLLCNKPNMHNNKVHLKPQNKWKSYTEETIKSKKTVYEEVKNFFLWLTIYAIHVGISIVTP